MFKRDRLFLLPGDSPIGLRLPLASLVELLPLEFPAVLPDDTMGEQTALPQRHVLDDEPALDAEAAEEAVRTAMAIEARDGHLCIFMPPVANAEDFAALVAAIEQVAAASNRPVYLEGYTPPDDPRLSNIKVTPDPGVIEVNVHPATSWEQAVDITTGVYEEAAKVRLAAEKFMLDGRHVGTGGGNHIVLGGITPKDSPFLRRPDLLASIVTYWQNHPSLSYLFSGTVHRPDQPGAARRRGAARVALRARDRAGSRFRIATRRSPCPGWSIACSATCWSTCRATRTGPRSASTSCTRRTGRPAGWGWSSSAPSRCRRMRA